MDARTNAVDAGRASKKSWRQRWNQTSPGEKMLWGVGITALVVVAFIGFWSLFVASPAKAPAARNALVGGMEVPIGNAVRTALEPRFKGIEDAQTKTDKSLGDLGKRVGALEVPQPAFNYQLLSDTIAGKK